MPPFEPRKPDETKSAMNSPIAHPAYTIIIPAYNEENRISSLLESLSGANGAFLVVCDGNDRTPEIVSRFAGAHPGLSLSCLTFKERLGKGGAIMKGFLHSDTPVVGFMDADGSTGIAEMQKMIGTLDRADAVIGSRWLPGSVLNVHQGLFRRVQSRFFNIMIRLLFGLSFKDTQCGAKVFKKEAIDAIRDDMVSKGFEFDVELLWRLSRKGLHIIEYPIEWNNREDSRVRMSDVMKMFTGLISLRMHG
jgi:glycosyltransferase involved in cell wall biosynthesis